MGLSASLRASLNELFYEKSVTYCTSIRYSWDTYCPSQPSDPNSEASQGRRSRAVRFVRCTAVRVVIASRILLLIEIF